MIDPAEPADDPFVLVPREREPNVYDRYIELCAHAGFSPRIGQEAPQIHTIVELVALGIGVALVPASLAGLRRPGVVYRPLRDTQRFTTETGLLWLRDNPSTTLRHFTSTATRTYPCPTRPKAESP